MEVVDADEVQNALTPWPSRGDSRLIIFEPVQPTSEEAWNEERCEPFPEVASAVLQIVAPQRTEREFVLVRLAISDFPASSEFAEYQQYNLLAVHDVHVIRC